MSDSQLLILLGRVSKRVWSESTQSVRKIFPKVLNNEMLSPLIHGVLIKFAFAGIFCLARGSWPQPYFSNLEQIEIRQ